jgi:hypothetical protein
VLVLDAGLVLVLDAGLVLVLDAGLVLVLDAGLVLVVDAGLVSAMDADVVWAMAMVKVLVVGSDLEWELDVHCKLVLVRVMVRESHTHRRRWHRNKV